MNKDINPEMILLARESRGVTQADLSKQLNVTQAAISKAEKIAGKVSDELLCRIAQLLNYPENFFFQLGHSYPPSMPLHRKQQSLAKKIQHQIEAEANVRRLQIQKLMDSIELEENRIPEFLIDDYETAEKVAISTRRYLKLPKGPIENLSGIIESFGIVIVPCNLYTDKIDGFTMTCKDSRPIIFINEQMPWCRIRFTLAHEFGHIIMNHVPNQTSEDEANEFASSFLMPRDDLRKDYFMKKISISGLAELKPYWKVSMQSLLVRAGRIGCITPDEQKKLFMQMNYLGYRKKEPVSIPPEYPILLKKIIEIHKIDLEYSEEEFLGMLCSFKESFSALYPYLQDSKKEKIKFRLVK
jgi:Zn-dependent peptidase ImmA (M78 family)/DNA-binding XRE family transcriptional regulator